MPTPPDQATPPLPLRQHKRRGPRPLALLASLLLTLLIAMPIAFLATPSLIRWKMTRDLVSADQAQRQKALAYVVRQAPNDDRVTQAAVEALSVPDDLHFQQIFHALDMAGLWGRPRIPDESWLRWLDILGSDKNDEARIMAIRQTTELRELASDKRLLTLFEKWLKDKSELVRYNALIALADLAGHAAEPAAVQRLIAQMTDDPQPTIAAEAWVLLGLIDPISGKQANWRNVPYEVAGAILWAVLKTNPNHPQPAIEALTDPGVPASVRAAAAYALHFNDSLTAQTPLRWIILPEQFTASPQVSDIQWIAWRAILSLNDPIAPPLWLLDEPEEQRPLLWASLFNHAKNRGLSEHTDLWITEDRLTTHPVSALAVLEGLSPGNAALGPCPSNASPYIRLAWTAATTTPDVATIRDLFAHDSAPIRDQACVTAARRFDEATNTALIGALLRDFNDNAKRSGCILAGLTNLRPRVTIQGQEVDLLERRLQDEDVWTVQEMHRVALWMQGRLPKMDGQLQGLMSRPDMPVSSLLLALLHRHPAAAMNELFSPLSDPPVFKAQSLNPRLAGEDVPLMELLVKYRWIHVLRAMSQPMSDTPLPPFNLWADPGLQAFELQVIRNDWLLRRPSSMTASLKPSSP